MGLGPVPKDVTGVRPIDMRRGQIGKIISWGNAQNVDEYVIRTLYDLVNLSTGERWDDLPRLSPECRVEIVSNGALLQVVDNE